jgi:hypothetical protein
LADRGDGLDGCDRFGGKPLLDLHEVFLNQIENLAGGERLAQLS